MPETAGEPGLRRFGLKLHGVQSAVAFPGLSISGFSIAPNAGIVFFCLDAFEDRKTPELSGPASD